MTADRAGYIAGLRMLADLLEQHGDLPLPYQGKGTPMSFPVSRGTAGQRHARVTAIAGMLTAPMSDVDDTSTGVWDQDQGSAGEPVRGSGEGGNVATAQAQPADPDLRCPAVLDGYWQCKRHRHHDGDHMVRLGGSRAVWPQSTQDETRAPLFAAGFTPAAPADPPSWPRDGI